MLSGKKAAEKYLSIWWFFTITIIAIGIISAVVVNSLSDINTKSFESDILANKVISCLISGGELNSHLTARDFDIFKECSLSKEIIDASQKYYLLVEVYNFSSCQTKESCTEKVLSLSYGVSSFEAQCAATEAMEANSYPECIDKYIVGVLNNTEVILRVKAGSNSQGAISNV